MKRNRRDQGARRSGLTLIEIMIVLLILVTMAGLGVFAFRAQLETAKRRTAFNYVKELATYVDLYELNVGRPPSTDQGLGALLNCPPDITEAKWGGPYIKDSATSLDPWGSEYQYASPGRDGRRPFEIWTTDPNGNEIASWMSTLD